MKQFIESVVDSIVQSGLVEVEVSARHVHLTQEDVELLFGKGAVLHPKRPLSQPGQFLSEERVTLIGPKGKKERVAVLGPVRKATQVELSISDCVALGIKAPVRESGDLRDAGPVVIEGPKGTLDASSAVIVARAHVHVPPQVAAKLDLQDKERVSVQASRWSRKNCLRKQLKIRISIWQLLPESLRWTSRLQRAKQRF